MHHDPFGCYVLSMEMAMTTAMAAMMAIGDCVIDLFVYYICYQIGRSCNKDLSYLLLFTLFSLSLFVISSFLS